MFLKSCRIFTGKSVAQDHFLKIFSAETAGSLRISAANAVAGGNGVDRLRSRSHDMLAEPTLDTCHYKCLLRTSRHGVGLTERMLQERY